MDEGLAIGDTLVGVRIIEVVQVGVSYITDIETLKSPFGHRIVIEKLLQAMIRVDSICVEDVQDLVRPNVQTKRHGEADSHMANVHCPILLVRGVVNFYY